MIPLPGHTSPATAFLVEDYPYGFKLRCKLRAWLEHKAKKGFRFVTQTTNPKVPGERWNTPKPSTYVEMAASMFLDDQGHVQWTGVGQYTRPVDILQFVLDFPEADFSVLRAHARARVSPTGLLAKLASGAVRQVVSVNGVRVVDSEEKIERERSEHAADLAVWMQIAHRLGVS